MKHWFNDQHFRSLLKNTSYLAVSKGVAAVAGIATLAFAGRALGLTTFGLLILIVSYAQAANGLSKFQSWQVMVRYGGAALARGDPATFRRATNFSLGLDLISGLAGMAGAMALLPVIGHWFGIGDDNLGLALAFCLLIPTMGAGTPTGILRVLDRFDLISWNGTITPISRAILTGIGFLQGWDFLGFVAIWFATDLAGDLFFWFLALRELKRRRLSAGIHPSLKTTGLDRVWPFAIKVNLNSSLEAAWSPIARLIVGGLLGPANAAIYRVAASLADSAQKPADLLGKAYYPQVVRMDPATKHPWRLMVRSAALAGGFALVAVAILVLGGRPLIGALFGAEFLPVYPVLMILVSLPLLAILGFPLRPMLYALDRPGAPLKGRLIGTIVYFVIVAPLCTQFGVRGAAIAIVAGNLVMIAFMLFALRREYRRVRSQ